MNNRKYIPLFMILLGVLIIGIAYIQSLNERPTATVPKKWHFTLPEGDAKAGKTDFLRLQCFVCHKNALSEIAKVPPDTKWQGPDLTTGYEKLPDTYLAESIIKKHTNVADPFYTPGDSLEGMGKYNQHLTVQELVDLVAFLKQPPKDIAQK